MHSTNSFPRLYFALAGLLLLTLGSTVRATIVGTSAANLDGSFTYHYTVNNPAGSFDIWRWSLDFDFAAPDWDQAGGVTVPNVDWWGSAGTPVTGLSAQDFSSLGPWSDVFAGTSLGGFSFTSWYAPGTVVFSEFDAAGLSSSAGTTVGPSSTGSPRVPEGSGPYALMAAAALVACARKLRSAASTSIADGN